MRITIEAGCVFIQVLIGLKDDTNMQKRDDVTCNVNECVLEVRVLNRESGRLRHTLLSHGRVAEDYITTVARYGQRSSQASIWTGRG